MKYENITVGTFVSRPNRFIADVKIADTDGLERTVKCHVKNTGRCKEILVPGAKSVLSGSNNPERKTKFDLVSVYKNGMLINIDSQAPNDIFGEALAEGKIFGPEPKIRREVKHGDSRFDFYVETEGRKIFAEVKGVTLENDGITMFPDAPTVRGVKHVNGLAQCIEEGFEAYAVFVVQMDRAEYFTPNYEMHEEFGLALERASDAGVKTLAYTCSVKEDSVTLAHPLEIRLGRSR